MLPVRKSILAAVLSTCSIVHAQNTEEKSALAQFETNPKFKQAYNEGRQLRSEDKALRPATPSPKPIRLRAETARRASPASSRSIWS